VVFVCYHTKSSLLLKKILEVFMSKTVLLVEDTDDTRELMRLMLEMLGHNVIEAADGQEAVDIAQGNGFDLVLMDIAMPVKDGIEATREMKQIDKISDVPIIAITAHSDKYKDEALEAGVTEIVKKPVNFEDLKPILSHYLSA
jgi:CheY-like chemotaxis protein